MNNLPYKLHCNNCGKFGHLNRNCKEPITSIGIICVRIADNELRNKVVQKTSLIEKIFNILKFNSKNNKFLTILDEYNPKIEFLMIKRKHSLGFLEFIRGRYDVEDYQKIVKLFEHMTEEEIDKIKTSDFDTIWCDVWGKTAQLKIYEDEYNRSKEKYNLIKYKSDAHNVLGLKFFTDNITPKWKHGEWGFPKGRRSHYEKNLTCAIREFQEETGYTQDDYFLIENILPLKEVFLGTNGIPYKHIYYLAILNENCSDPTILDDNNEVGEIDWFTYSKCSSLIRTYHTEKKKVLYEAFKFIVGLSESSSIV